MILAREFPSEGEEQTSRRARVKLFYYAAVISRASLSVLSLTAILLPLVVPSILALDSSPVTKLAMGWDASADPSVVGYRLYQQRINLFQSLL